MKSETAKELLERYEYSKESAIKAVEIAEQELCEKYAADIHKLVERWETADRKIDDEYLDDLREARAEIATLRTALNEANKRCEIAQKVIADKNAGRGEGATERGGAMTLNYYQQQAMTTCLPSSANSMYMLLMIAEEIGELCGKVSKAIRKKQIVINDNELYAIGSEDFNPTNDIKNQLKGELGDILWGVAGLSDVMKWTLEEVAQYNLDKLAARKQSNTIVSHTDH